MTLAMIRKFIQNFVENKRLKQEVRELQFTVDSLLSGTRLESETSNQYNTTEAQITEIVRKYNGLAEWGCDLTKAIVELRAAFIYGSGFKYVPIDNKQTAAVDRINQILEYNNIDIEVGQALAREAEIEGRILVRLVPEENKETSKKTIRIVHLPYSEYKYKIITGDYYNIYEQCKYTDSKSNKDEIMNMGEFVYQKFGGRLTTPNETAPIVGYLLGHIEAVDKCFYDFRQINNLFSRPTPVFTVPDADAAAELNATLKSTNWKIGNAVITNGNMIFVSPSAATMSALMDEITYRVKIISSVSGIPVHFLGMPDLMSNRATADSLVDLVYGATERARNAWIGFYEELGRDCLKMLTDKFHETPYDLNSFKVELPFMTSDKVLKIVQEWLPLFNSGCLSKKTIISKIPDINVDEEIKSIEAEKQASSNEYLKRFMETEENQNE